MPVCALDRRLLPCTAHKWVPNAKQPRQQHLILIARSATIRHSSEPAIPRRTLNHRPALYIAVCLGLIGVSLGPVNAHAPWDKLAHFLTYGMLGLLAYRVAPTDRSYLVHCLAIAALGALIELAQTLVPGRQGSGLDLLANLAGVAAAATLVYLARGPRTAKR
ncbi:VanZ family protein [Pseudohalioglobus sediminis]|uniref:VanZ family protein n=1 Tax=Pseudohalioglobus sediminis TaxID=2606449 RepID=A0A5B0X2P9_9GAMM|nr:VanZ family protein [Pseudohalioglobus sediminis]